MSVLILSSQVDCKPFRFYMCRPTGLGWDSFIAPGFFWCNFDRRPVKNTVSVLDVELVGVARVFTVISFFKTAYVCTCVCFMTFTLLL